MQGREVIEGDWNEPGGAERGRDRASQICFAELAMFDAERLYRCRQVATMR